VNKDLFKDRARQVNNEVVEIAGKSIRAKRLECNRRAKKMRIDVDNEDDDLKRRSKHEKDVEDDVH
jgi:predicted HTH domain antitoxin